MGIIAVSTNTYHGFNAIQALEGIAAAGFRYVEIATVRNWTEHLMPEWTEEDKSVVVSKAKELGLTFLAMSGHCDLSDESRLADFRKNMSLAHDIGCQWIISSTGEAHFGNAGDDNTESKLIHNLKMLAPELEKLNLKLGIETHGANYGTGSAVKRLVNAVGSNRIGVNFDTANVVFWGKCNEPEKDLANCIDSVNYCHLKDKIGFDSSWNFPPIGQGELPLLNMMDFMKDNVVDCPFSIEIEFDEEFVTRGKRADDLEYVNKCVRDSFDFLHANGKI